MLRNDPALIECRIAQTSAKPLHESQRQHLSEAFDPRNKRKLQLL
jgi:hypothetical protein